MSLSPLFGRASPQFSTPAFETLDRLRQSLVGSTSATPTALGSDRLKSLKEPSERLQGREKSNCKTTSDLGQALLEVNFDDVGKIKDQSFGASLLVPHSFITTQLNVVGCSRLYEDCFGLA
jgi:hypothetical protein